MNCFQKLYLLREQANKQYIRLINRWQWYGPMFRLPRVRHDIINRACKFCLATTTVISRHLLLRSATICFYVQGAWNSSYYSQGTHLRSVLMTICVCNVFFTTSWADKLVPFCKPTEGFLVNGFNWKYCYSLD